MTYVPDVDNDVFISYTHIDNEPLTEGQRGWISDFHHSLQVRLKQLLGEELAIWRDAKLTGHDYFDDTLVRQLRKTAVLVSVLTPRYLRSEYCLKELAEFFEGCQQRGTIRLDDRARVFKVIKTHVPREEHPRELQGLLGYEFYRIDEATGRAREFLLDPSQEAWRQYWAKLEDLAYDIHGLLKAIKEGAQSAAQPPLATIFLAETTSDAQPERDCLKRDFQARGCAVLPSRPLPLQAAALEAAVRADLARCRLSVHVIGRNYGIVPEDDARSLVQLQNEIAAAHAPSAEFCRLIWIPEGLQVADPRQRDYLAALRAAPNASGVELLETPIEEVKTFIHDKLAAKTKPAAQTAPATTRETPARIYVICDPLDLDAVRPLEDWFYEQRCEVLLSAIEGDETQLREYHQENLALCDGAVIFYGAATELWVRAKLRDLEKAYGCGRPLDRPLPAAVYVAPPQTSPKERFRTLQIKHVIKQFGAFSPEPLTPFLAEVRGS